MGIPAGQEAETRARAPHVGSDRVSVRVSPASAVAGETILPAASGGNGPPSPPSSRR